MHICRSEPRCMDPWARRWIGDLYADARFRGTICGVVDDPPGAQRYEASRLNASLRFGFFAVFVVVLTVLPHGGTGSDTALWLVALAFMIVMAFQFLARVLSAGALEIGATSMTVRSYRRGKGRSYDYRECGVFRVLQWPPGRVAFDWSPAHARTKRPKRRSIYASEFGLRARQLAGVLNERRAENGSSPARPAE